VVGLSCRFPLSRRRVDEMRAARGLLVSHDTVRPWGLKFGQAFASPIRRRRPGAGDRWHPDEVVIKIAGRTPWLWRAGDQHGRVLAVLLQSRRDQRAAQRRLRQLLTKPMRPPRVMVTAKLASYPAAERGLICPGSSTAGTGVGTTGPRTRTSRPVDANAR
jgi:putative transposase